MAKDKNGAGIKRLANNKTTFVLALHLLLYCESISTVRGPWPDIQQKALISPALPAVSGESSLTVWQVEELTTKTTEGAALEVNA